MQLLGQHHVSHHSIRRTAVICAALDSHARDLFNDGFQADNSGRMRSAYEELLTENLLLLAVSIRIKLGQESDRASINLSANHAGVYASSVNGEEEEVQDFTIKDVCDKIIHADSIRKRVKGEGESMLVELEGTRSYGNKRKEFWSLALSVGLFCGTIFDWLDGLEDA